LEGEKVLKYFRSLEEEKKSEEANNLIEKNSAMKLENVIRNCIKLNKGIWSSYMSVDLYSLLQIKSAYLILFLLFLMKKDHIKVIRFQNTK